MRFSEEKCADGGRLFARFLQRGVGANDPHRHCSQSRQEGWTGADHHLSIIPYKYYVIDGCSTEGYMWMGWISDIWVCF